jgi:ligand-binding sensor domain-containing protein
MSVTNFLLLLRPMRLIAGLLLGVLCASVYLSGRVFAEETEAKPVPSAADASPAAEEITDQHLPFVYTDWEHFTTADGLPNDHVFTVKVDGHRVWVGTEDGLACYDKRTGKFETWKEEDGLPWRVVSALDVDRKTGDLWIGLFGGGLARFSAGRFDHFHQLNSGLVNDVVYGVAIENDHVWAATTAGASRYNVVSRNWSIFTEKNAPMEEIWNYGISYNDGRVYLGVWGSGVLEFDVATERWNVYLDPDGEMEINLNRDDGIVHVITTGTSYVDKILWVSTYFGMSRYDGRNWRGYYAHETGLPSDFANAVKGRSANEAWYATDQGIGAVVDFPTDTWVTYTMDPSTRRGQAVIQRGERVLKTLDLERCLPHNFALWVEFDGDDVWVGTSKGLARARGAGYYPRLKEVQP